MLHLFAGSPAARGVQGVSSLQRQQTRLLYHQPTLCDPVGHNLLQSRGGGGAFPQLSTRWQQTGGVKRSKAGLRVGTASFQTCFWRRPSGRAAPEPAPPFPRPSCSGAACLVPGDPGRSGTPVPLLVTKGTALSHTEGNWDSHLVTLILCFCLNNKKKFITS